MTKRHTRLRVNKVLLPIAVVSLVAVFVAAAALYKPLQAPPTNTAAEYFEIVNPAADAPSQFVDNKTGLKLYTVFFTIKPIKGPAHDITITGWSGTNPYDVGNLAVRESGYAELKSDTPLFITKDDQGRFPVKIHVSSAEASGFITFYLVT